MDAPTPMTRSTALSINTSHASYACDRASTPLGERHRIWAYMAGGGKREVALVRDGLVAAEIVSAMTVALAALREAAGMIADDREGRS